MSECKTWSDDYCEATGQYVAAKYYFGCDHLSSCDKGYCSPTQASGGGGTGTCYTNSDPGEDGLPCSKGGKDGICIDAACVTSPHHAYHYDRGATGCEAKVCRDETGSVVEDKNCADAGTKWFELPRCAAFPSTLPDPAPAPAPAPGAPPPPPAPEPPA